MSLTILTRTELETHAATTVTDRVLHRLGAELRPASILKVGACDGVLDDLTWGWIHRYAMDAVFIEPLPDRCDRLREHARDLAGHVTIECCAIAAEEGTVEMCVIPEQYMGGYTPNGMYVHPALYGMSSVYPPRNGLTGEHDAAVLAEVGERVKVPARRLAPVLEEAGVERVDLLSIDTEGHDWIVLQQFDFARYRPYWVEVELANLSAADREAALDYLRVAGYFVYHAGRDGYAVRVDAVRWGRE